MPDAARRASVAIEALSVAAQLDHLRDDAVAIRAATLMQAKWRGRKERRRRNKLTPEERLRYNMGRYLFHKLNVDDREVALNRLQYELSTKEPRGWGEPPKRPAPSAKKDAASLEEATEVTDDEKKAAVMLQARVRGHESRKKSVKEVEVPPAPPPASAPPAKSVGLSIVRKGLAGAVLGLLAAWSYGTLVLPPLTSYCLSKGLRLLGGATVAAFGSYGAMRFPAFLGGLVGWIVTNIGLNGLPLGMGNLRLQLWLSRSPMTLHIDAHFDDFFYSNPPKIKCRHKHLVEIRHLDAVLSLPLAWIWRGTSEDGPVVLNIQSIDASGVLVNIMLGETGEINIPALGKQLTENELRAMIAGKVIHPYRMVRLPNVLRVKIMACRGLLDLPKLSPRVEVTVRRTKLTTLPGVKTESTDGATEYSFGGAELILPVPEYDALLIVKVFNEKKKLLGQWFMTIKYLIAAPNYCKHSVCKVFGRGHIAGTFLLTDAKLRGSACRALGPHELGRGLSGEIDMAIQWTHMEGIDPPPPKPMTAMQQMGINSFEGDLKMGNKEELKTFFESVPVRLNVERIDIHGLVVEMSDLVSGLLLEDEEAEKEDQKSGKKQAKISHVKLEPMVNVTLLGFFEIFVAQAISLVSTKPSALLSASDEIFSGLYQNVVRTLCACHRALN